MAAVFGISGGGPIAITFAIRHSNRCSVLLTECGISGNLVHHSAEQLKSKPAEIASTSIMFARMPEVLGPKAFMTEMFKMSSTEDAKGIERQVKEAMNDPARMKIYEKLKIASAELAMYPAGF